MLCPYCEEEMEKGYIHCHNGIYNMYWTSHKDHRKVKLHSWKQSFLINKIDNVYFCSKCKIIIKKLLTK
jgi:hypothetical protein